MPRGDGTGPTGQGSQTGRQAGYCSGFYQPGYVNDEIPCQRLAYRRGRGNNRGQSRCKGRRGSPNRRR
ncbi:DUF5320 domain-containing protein [Sporohalobacter salinus]|uniref:DUF5320 domain-containing protein n=1 Tax=Sporohalobacter salinus TaxID=1494606 RepID=UPI00196066F1|nr:DUF5320 domain-containing protein [Sporohalobacter salinus]MBM7624667.1 hypothetical protein [Sporohalobacter salinus]